MLTEQKEPAKRPELKLLVVITTPKLADKATALLTQGRVLLQYQFLAMGTASSDLLAVLGLGSSEKCVVLSMLPRSFAAAMLKKLQIELGLGAINNGIAFTMPISGGSNMMVKMIESLDAQDVRRQLEKDVTNMTENNFSMIMAIVNQGYSEEVMDAARPAGARGGTVVRSRRVGSEDAMKFWGINVQAEKELVMIVVSNQHKKAIMQAISEKCGSQTDAHGLLLSLPVDDAIGLKMPNDD